MKCLHLCNDFLGSKVHQNLYEELSKIAIDQTVFYPSRQDKQIIEKNLKFNFPYDIVISKPLKTYHKIFFRLKIKFLFRELIEEVSCGEFNLVHATTLFSDGALAYKIFKKYQIPYIVSVRATDIEIFLKFRPDLLYLVLKIIDNASRIVFISNSLQHKFFSHSKLKPYKSNYKNKCQVIYNGIDHFWIQHHQAKKNIIPNKIIYIGSLINRKNSDKLVQTVTNLSKEFPEKKITITVIGDGPLKQDILKFQTAYPETVFYIDRIQEKIELKKILRDHHIFAMPSNGETFGLVYLEALSQGLPIVGLKNEGIDGIFDKPVGIFAPDSSIDSITLSILKAIEEYSNFDINEIHFERFNWATIAKIYSDLYKNTIDNALKFK